LVALALAAAFAAPATAGEAAPPDQTPSTLIIYRAYAAPTAFGVTISIDGARIGALRKEEAFSVSLPPGSHQLTATWPGITGQRAGEGEFVTAPGQTQYVEVTAGMRTVAREADPRPDILGNTSMTSYTRAGTKLKAVDPAAAQAALATCCEVRVVQLPLATTRP
jgi:hypothetical protein